MRKIANMKIWVMSISLSIGVFIYSSTSANTDSVEYNTELTMSSDTANFYINSLDTAIREYKEIAANGGWPNFEKGPTIKTGAQDARIPTLRQILTIMGDYTGPSSDSDIYDEELMESVKAFQVRHGLEDDGNIGRKTQLSLTVPVEFRIAQMETTKERMSKMPDLGTRYVLVNIPGYYLKAVENNITTISSRIIVGTLKNATPLFQRPITEVSFNPQWYVPPGIARSEMMDKLRNNPEYFVKSNFVVRDSDGEVVDVTEINLDEESDSNYKFVQKSGEGNALGKVKFNLPDNGNIYLHSTANPNLFNKAERALSHGCIRVEMARELTHFVMSGKEGWDDERITNLYDSSNSRILKVEPVPVYAAYWTSWVDESTKKPYFYSDIYGRDKKRVYEILAKIKSPKDDTIKLAME